MVQLAPRKILPRLRPQQVLGTGQLHLPCVGLAEVLPYASPVGEYYVAVGVEFVGEFGAASILVDDGLDSGEGSGVGGDARDGDASSSAGDGEEVGALFEEGSDGVDLEDSFFVELLLCGVNR